MRVGWLVLGLVACTPAPQEQPLSGPGFDESGQLLSPQDDSYIVGLTYLRVINAAGPGGEFGDMATTVGTNLFTTEPEGFVGGAFRNEGRLNQWTMTVWSSEQTLLDWAYNDPDHLQAMSRFWDVSARGKTTIIQRDASEMPMSWDDALTVLEGVEWYGGVE